MKITYKLTFWEYVRSGFVYTRLIFPTLYLPLYIGFVILIIAAPVAYIWSAAIFLRDGIPLQLILYGFAAPILTNLLSYVAFYVGWRQSRRRTVEIDNEGISFQYSRARFRKPWKSVDSVEEDSEYIYISAKPPRVPFLSTKMPRRQALSVMIPKHAFPSSAEADAFLNQAMAYWQPVEIDSDKHKPGSWPPAPAIRL